MGPSQRLCQRVSPFRPSMAHRFIYYTHFHIRQQDLISWTIAKCPSCFRFLLLHRTIMPSYYNCDGESLLYMVLLHKRKASAKIVTCGLSINNLVSPLWLANEQVGPSALDIAHSDRVVMEKDMHWGNSNNIGNRNRNILTTPACFILKKHPLRSQMRRF
jgi:hypothetical protein